MSRKARHWKRSQISAIAALLVVQSVLVTPLPASAGQGLSGELARTRSAMSRQSHEFTTLDSQLKKGLDPSRMIALQKLVHRFESLSASLSKEIAQVEETAGIGPGHRSSASPVALMWSYVLSESNMSKLKVDVADVRAIDAQVAREHLDLRQAVVSDKSKSVQSQINQSNDAVSQQANLASSFLEELSTILSAIIR